MQQIKKLDVQLANQIAAGEVVERPASVVKELLENSLDAGAKCIDIEITAGGTGLIRIRDDGYGIPKQQLELALAPHATSKISKLDDLECISSFGFRGEALASISSVSRFTLNSRVRGSSEGWQAQAEGSEQIVNITPVATNEGTRIDVRELFFNTPARRRFLRTEKTEFSHIEDAVKKAALANFNVAITLKHNGRQVRRFRAAEGLEQQEQRVASVVGRQFMLRSIRLDLSHQDIEIKGWLALPDYHRSQSDGQYFYVNNRPVRDKVLNHAIRQAYQQFIPEGRVPAYVLYLTLDPKKVDVNVHPTKHEVRFHDARLIHDLLVQSIERGLSEGLALIDEQPLEVRPTSHFAQAPDSTYANDNVNVNDNVNDNVKKQKSAHSGNYLSQNEQKQHLAYRSLLQSAQNLHSDGIAESGIDIITSLDGWRYLLAVDDELCLLQKHEKLILLSVNQLVNQVMDESKSAADTTDNRAEKTTQLKRLLFPEIIICANTEQAVQVKKYLLEHRIQAQPSDHQLSITEIPLWLDGLPIKEFSITLFNYQSSKRFENVNSNAAVKADVDVVSTHVCDITDTQNRLAISAQDEAMFILLMLKRCKDHTKLNYKAIAFSELPTIFKQHNHDE